MTTTTELDEALVDKARDLSYERLVVDWETTNVEGNRFWLRHFDLATLSLLRVVPE